MSYFKTTRGWQDSEFFGDNIEFSERDAWIWMIGEAQWKDGHVRVLGKRVFLKRGQFSSSIRFMAGKFGWSKDRVSRFLKRAEIWGMIASESATGQKVITICNYEKYQSVDQDGKDTNKDSNKDAPKDTSKDKLEEGKEGKEGKNKRRGAQSFPKPPDVSERVWADHLAARKAKRQPITETALTQMRQEAESLGWSLERALTEACSRGWASFKAEWTNNERKENGKQRGTDKQRLADETEKLLDKIRSGEADQSSIGHH